MTSLDDNSAVAKLAARRIAKARTQLLLNPKFVFWATCALHLKPVPVSGMAAVAGGAIGTDGSSLLYDPDFIAGDTWDDEELVGVIAHEVSHAVKGDCWRRGSRDPRRWNLAADARIDPELLHHGLKMPSHGSPRMDALLQSQANFGRSAEEIYRDMPDDEEGDDGGGLAGDVRDPTAKPAASAAEHEAAIANLEHRWEQIARQAAQIAKAQGYLPASMEHLVQPIRPRLDPYAMLHRFVSMCRRDDWTWARGNCRALWRGLYLPSLYSEGIGELLIGVDTSGSCANVAPKFFGFLDAVLSEVHPERTWLVECDAQVHKVTEFGPEDRLPAQVPVHGYGGTSMRPIWEWAAEAAIEPVCAIVLTDLEMTEHDLGEPQNFPCLWVVSSTDRMAPWGETVRLDE